MNQKGFSNLIVLLIVIGVIVVGVSSYLTFKEVDKNGIPQQQSQENGEDKDLSSKEDISSCVSTSNYAYEFYVVFSPSVSKQVAEQILQENNAKTFRLTSEPPSGYVFELPNETICESLESIYNVKDVFRIPALYRQPEKDQPTSGPINRLSCQNVPENFVTPNGYISSPSNNFTLTYYQNGNQLKDELENVGAYNIVPIGGEKKKTYYATFQNGKICKSVEALRQHPAVVEIDTVPFMPGSPPLP